MQVTADRISLADARFLDLVTYRRDGTPVSTPVLSTPRGKTLLIRTHHTAGKLKRLQTNASVEVAPFVRGRRVGAAQRGTARIVPDVETAECLDLLHRHHGLFGRAHTIFRHLYGRDVFIEVRLA